MQGSSAVDGSGARAANRHLTKIDCRVVGVLSTAERYRHFLDSPRLVAVLGRSDFSLADLKDRLETDFLVLTPHRLATYIP